MDYQNAIIIDMGGNSEIISSQEVMGAEVLDRMRSFEFIQSSKLIVYQRDYKTKEHGTIKAYATNRDCFVLIKTRTVPNYIISPEDPAAFAAFVNQRLSK
ncbi:MAG: PH domain-containing protein [Anaerohalosphaeraceae bacterium]